MSIIKSNINRLLWYYLAPQETRVNAICLSYQNFHSLVEPSNSQSSTIVPEVTDSRKKKGRRKQRARKVSASQRPTNHDPVTQPSPCQRTQATQTDYELPEKSAVTTGTQTQSMSMWDKSTQTPGARFAREAVVHPRDEAVSIPAPASAQPPSDSGLPQDQSPQTQPDSPELPLENPSQTQKPKRKRNPNELFMLTWNIDGLDQEDMKERFPQLLRYLSRWVLDIQIQKRLIKKRRIYCICTPLPQCDILLVFTQCFDRKCIRLMKTIFNQNDN